MGVGLSNLGLRMQIHSMHMCAAQRLLAMLPPSPNQTMLNLSPTGFSFQYSLQCDSHSASVSWILFFSVVSRSAISMIQALYASTDLSLGREKVTLLLSCVSIIKIPLIKLYRNAGIRFQDNLRNLWVTVDLCSFFSNGSLQPQIWIWLLSYLKNGAKPTRRSA